MLVQRKLMALGSINLRTGEFKMDEQKFKIGDVVELNSGGPLMTVIKVEDDWVGCCWYDGNSRVTDWKFFTSCLVRRPPHHRSPNEWIAVPPGHKMPSKE